MGRSLENPWNEGKWELTMNVDGKDISSYSLLNWKRGIAMSEEKQYAVIRTGGKQYRVEEGTVLVVDRLKAEAGDKVALKPVMVSGDDVVVDAKGLEKGVAAIRASLDKLLAKLNLRFTSQKLVGEMRSVIEPKIRNLNESVAKALGLPIGAPAGAVSAPGPAPARGTN